MRSLLINSLLTAFFAFATVGSVYAAGNYTVWSNCASGTNGNITNIVCGGGMCVGICSNKTIISSMDGTSWSTAFTATDIPTDVVYGGGKFFGCAGSVFLTSADGAAWTSATFHGANPNYTYNINAITCGIYGEMVAGGNNVILCSSDYGITWVPLQLGAIQANFARMTYLPVKDQFVGLGSGGVIVIISKNVDGSGNTYFTYSPIGTSQTMYFTGLDYNPYSQTWYGLIVDNIHDYWISASKDLYTWNHIDSGQGDINGFAFYNGMAFGMGSIRGNIPTVDTSGAWSHQNLNLANVVINDIAYGDSTIIMVGNNGVVFSSTNGTSWTACSSGTTQNLNKVIFVGTSGIAKKLVPSASFGGTFIAVGANGTIITTNHKTATRHYRPDGRTQPGLYNGSKNVPLHAFSINGRELKTVSQLAAGHRAGATPLQKQQGGGSSGLVVWH